jgi:hypothetical protein
MLEYAILIGLATIVAVTMQYVARRSVQTGLQMVNDAILDPPPPPDTSQIASVDVELNSTVTEQGDSSFRRTTTIAENVTGTSVNEETRLQVIQE